MTIMPDAMAPVPVAISPDAQWAALRTERGNFETGELESRLMLYALGDIRRALRAERATSLPAAREIALFQNGLTPMPGGYEPIEKVRWSAQGDRLFFIGRRVDGLGQVYSVEPLSGALKQLTQSPEDVASFAISADQSRLLFSTRALPDLRDRNQHGFVVGSPRSTMLPDVLYAASPAQTEPEVHFHITDLATGSTRPIGFKVPRSQFAPDIWISPDGRWSLSTSALREVPERWLAHPISERLRSLYPAVKLHSDGSITPDERYGDDFSYYINQLQVIDLDTGAAHPLIDAPQTGAYYGSAIAWSADGRRVAVSGVYRPIESCPTAERDRCARSPAVLEVALDSGAFNLIADSTTSTDLAIDDEMELEYIGSEEIAVRLLPAREGAAASASILRPLREQIYERIEGPWVKVSGKARERSEPDSVADQIAFGIREDMNSPPELIATDRRTGAVRRVTHLNPQLADVELLEVKKFMHHDAHGRKFTSGLLLPAQYRAGNRLPLVIQTYGFSADAFLVNGPTVFKTTAFAARPLASRGLIVVQAGCFAGGNVVGDFKPSGSWLTDTEMGRDAATCLESLIDALDEAQLIDPERVGLIGFSRTGMHVMHMVTFSDHPIVAATIGDSVAMTPACAAGLYGRESFGNFETSDLIGSTPFGVGVKAWLDRSPAMQLERVRAALRIETVELPPCYWDVFTTLKGKNRPVEMLIYPGENHDLRLPWTRYTSQEGNVDWFDFWLNGHEDPDVSKQAQYKRWRELKAQRDALIKEPRPPIMEWTSTPMGH